MLQDLIKLAINKINTFGESQYVITESNDIEPPQILLKHSKQGREIVVEDLSLIQSINATNNTLMLYEDGAITIISPVNYTYHQTEC